MPALTKGSSTADRFQVQSKIVDFQEGLRRRSLTKQNPVGDKWDLRKNVNLAACVTQRVPTSCCETASRHGRG